MTQDQALAHGHCPSAWRSTPPTSLVGAAPVLLGIHDEHSDRAHPRWSMLARVFVDPAVIQDPDAVGVDGVQVATEMRRGGSSKNFQVRVFLPARRARGLAAPPS